MFVCHVGMTKVPLLTLIPRAQPHLMLQLKYSLKLSNGADQTSVGFVPCRPDPKLVSCSPALPQGIPSAC